MSAPDSESKCTSIMQVMMLGALYIGISAGLIAFNKELMTPGKFPFPAAIGLLHAIFCSLMCGVLYAVKPELFTSLNALNDRAVSTPSIAKPSSEKKNSMQDGIMLKAICPIAVLFSAQIVLTNQAYLFADIAFLQMLKEANVVLVYLLSISFALEVFRWCQLRLIVAIVLATWMTVTGELHATAIGVMIQCAGCCTESIKITLTGYLLTSRGKGLDAWSYLLLVMPVSACVFAATILIFSIAMPHQQFLLMPAAADWVRMKWQLLANCFVALGLNVSMAVFIKSSSSVALVIAGIIKDVLIVLVGIIFLGHETTVLQASGFAIQVFLILLYSLLKTFPKEFERGYIEGFQVVFLGKTLERAKITESPQKDREIAREEYGSIQDREQDKDTRLKTYRWPDAKQCKV